MGSGKGSSGGGSQQMPPTQSTVTQNSSNLPEYARPYFESLMGRAQTVSQQPYQPYEGDRIAGFDPMQTQGMDAAQTNVGNYLPNFDQAQTSIQGSTGFNPEQLTNTYAAQQFTPQSWNDPGVAAQFMSPYQSGVTDIQTQEALRQYGIQQTQADTQAQSRGAFGGDRAAILDAENARNMNFNLDKIQKEGLQSAYTAGQGQFNQQQQMGLASNQLNNQNLQQQSQLGMGAAGGNNQYGLAKGQLDLTAGQNLAGLGQARQAAGNVDMASLLNAGGLKQAQQQTVLNTGYQDFLNQRSYPGQQLNWLSGVLRGVPVSANSDVTQTAAVAPPNQYSQLAGLGLGAAGLSKLLG